MQIIVALLTLSVIILVHELGHFIAAKLSGVWVEEFGIGLPPRIWGKKIGKTIYSVNWLPIGGFVRLHGEDPKQKVTDPKRSFSQKNAFQKIFIALSGVFMNYVLAVFAFSLIFGQTGISRGVIVDEVLPDFPAVKAGIHIGDEIIRVGEREVSYTDEFPFLLSRYFGESTEIQIKRNIDGQIIEETLKVDLSDYEFGGPGTFGVFFGPRETLDTPLWQKPIFVYHGIRKANEWLARIAESTVFVFRSLLQGKGVEGLAGPLGIVAVTSEVAKYGFYAVAEFAAIISINLALLNLIPFPPLDGSRVVFVAIESFFGKKLIPKVESAIYTTGFVILLSLVVLLTAQELPKLISAGSISGFVESIIGE